MHHVSGSKSLARGDSLDIVAAGGVVGVGSDTDVEVKPDGGRGAGAVIR